MLRKSTVFSRWCVGLPICCGPSTITVPCRLMGSPSRELTVYFLRLLGMAVCHRAARGHANAGRAVSAPDGYCMQARRGPMHKDGEGRCETVPSFPLVHGSEKNGEAVLRRGQPSDMPSGH